MTITALPFRTAIAVVVIAVFAAISITPTRAEDTPPDTATAIVAASTSSPVGGGRPTSSTSAETTTTAAATTTTAAATTTTSSATTTTAATTTTTSSATTTTAATTTTTSATTTTTNAATTTTNAATTTTTLLPGVEGDDVEDEEIAPDEDVCDPQGDPTAVDTDGTAVDDADGSSTTGTTMPAADVSGKTSDKETVDGEEGLTDADPCNPEEDELGFTPVVRIETVRDIVFPIVGRAGYYDGFGACRDGCTREHHGIDIGTFGWKGLPVVASHDGVVIKTTYDQRLAGCAVILRGHDGWQTRYVHLNTDFPGTDTNGYSCLAPGIELGAEVVAGQILGWVGDSGNAENTIPHIHFEIRNPAGVPINAYKSLNAARTIEFDWLSQDPSNAYNSIVAANYTNDAATAVIISATEARKLSADENAASAYDSPVIVIDESNPDSALEQIERLELDRAIVMSDSDSAWISELVAPLVGLVESQKFPLPYTQPVRMMPDSGEIIPAEPDPVDRFATIIARSADTDTDDDPEVEAEVPAADTEADPEAIEAAAEAGAQAEDEAGARTKTEAEYLEAFEEYTVNHRSVVISAGSEAVSDLTSVEGPAPTRSDESRAPSLTARRASNTDTRPTPLPLWWNTGDGWVWTDDPLDMPERGIVYLTDAQATPWTLAFLTSLVEADPVPLWRG
jgi:murein DD-endopeptidase MepM/ murein hydrolase activator NlpD